MCPYCAVLSNDQILSECKEDEYEDLDSEFPFCIGESTYRVIKCSSCDKIFFSVSTSNGFGTFYEQNYPEIFNKITFSKQIQTISPDFTECYNQALEARDKRLDYLVGAGLRKSLEYLIKDFVSSITPEKAYDIQLDNSLSNILCNRLPQNHQFDDIKELAKRVWWIGSDYTHTSKKYEEYNEEDIISLLSLLVSEIERYYKKQDYLLKINRK